jgi:undecaprenyl-diphosphatase
MVRTLILLASGFWLLSSSASRDFVYSVLLGIIEGLTEFVPISSTGHLLLAEHSLPDLDMESGFWKTFAVVIQIGAIAAVVVYFRDRIAALLRQGVVRTSSGRISPVMLILIATAPVLAAGFFVQGWVAANMENPLVIALAVGIGGVVMWLLELVPQKAVTKTVEDVSLAQALLIGCAQILAVVFPGTSRSAATIMGGLVAGLSRPAAAEFSFFLAIPAMSAACGYLMLKQLRSDESMTGHQWLVLFVGTAVSFVVAWVVIAVFMKFIRRHTFIPFAIYRILLAIVVLAMYFTMRR